METPRVTVIGYSFGKDLISKLHSDSFIFTFFNEEGITLTIDISKRNKHTYKWININNDDLILIEKEDIRDKNGQVKRTRYCYYIYPTD